MKSWPHYNDNGFTLRNSLFGDVKLTKNPYLNEYFYSGNGITFDARRTYLLPSGGFGEIVMIFGADMISSAHIDNKKRYLGSW